MSNFVAKLIPFLPSSMQFEELTEAASAFNSFSEKLVSCRTHYVHSHFMILSNFMFWGKEEKLLVRSEWDNARKQLMGCRDRDTVLTFDYMSILIYIESIDHWSLTESDKAAFDPVPVIGKLLHSEELRSRKLGVLAALASSSEDTAFLLANTVSKMLDSSKMKVVEMALRAASHLISPSLVPLFSKGIQRALKSKSSSVRKVAWNAYSEMVRTDEHILLSTEILKTLTMNEADVDVLCSIAGFFQTQQHSESLQEVTKIWVEHVQEALIQRPFAVLQCRILGLLRSRSIESTEYIKSVRKIRFESGQQHVHMELLKTLCSDDDSAINVFADIPRGYFAAETPEIGLLMLRELSKHSVKSVLLYQEELLGALDSKDPEVRLLALRVLENAANSENWQLLLENCIKVVGLCEPVENETMFQAARIALKLIGMFEGLPRLLESALELLDKLPESLSEDHLDRMLSAIKLGPRPSVSFLTRSYAFDQPHSLIHDLYLIHLTSQEAPLDPSFSVRLLVEILERSLSSGADPLFKRKVLLAMAWQVSRGQNVELGEEVQIKSSDRCIQWLFQLVSTRDIEMLREFVDHHGDIDTIISHTTLDYDERVRLFEEAFAEPGNESALDIIDNRSTDSFTQDKEEMESCVFPSIGELPTFPESESESIERPLALQIASDLFKGLI